MNCTCGDANDVGLRSTDNRIKVEFFDRPVRYIEFNTLPRSHVRGERPWRFGNILLCWCARDGSARAVAVQGLLFDRNRQFDDNRHAERDKRILESHRALPGHTTDYRNDQIELGIRDFAEEVASAVRLGDKNWGQSGVFLGALITPEQ